MTSPAAATVLADTQPVSNIFDKAICVSVQISCLGTKRRVPKNLIDVDADKSMLSFGKEILRSEKLKTIRGLHAQMRRYLLDVSLPAQSLFRGGIYAIPIPLVSQVDAKLDEFEAAIDKAVEEFLIEYPTLVESAKESLRALYNPREYPPVETVRRTFGISRQYIKMGVPNALAEISAAIFKREEEKSKIQVAEAMDEVRAALRVGMKELIDHMVDRLTPKEGDDPSKPKKFHHTLVNNMRQFLSTFDARNIGEDKDLSNLVNQAKQLIEGVEPAKLRENTSLREYVLNGMTQIKGTLDSMVVSGQTRLIFADDDDDE